MMYEIERTTRFKKDYKLAMKRGLDKNHIMHIVSALANGEQLDEKFKDHALTGNYSGYRECHIEPDWLLVYKKSDDILILTLYRTGTHSDLF